MAERSIDKREQYVSTDRESRAVLKEMAAEWLKLAEAPVD
jgi:hypothetical protein